MPADDEVTPLALTCRISAPADGRSLLDFLGQRFRYHDRPKWLAEVAGGRVLVNGVPVPANHRLRRGDSVTYLRVHAEPRVDTNVAIVHCDQSLVVVEKPAHLPMHADGPFVRHTLVHVLRTRLAAPELQLVHRLDRETSGLCVLARTKAARAALQRQFAAGTVGKAYLAVVRGPAGEDFVIDQAIGHAVNSSVALRRSAAPDAVAAKPARTSFQVAGRGPERSLLRARPETGRTHQIRVHLEAAGMPLLGDKLYGRADADYLAFVARVKAGGHANDVAAGEPGRQLLHASELAFEHPDDGRRVLFESPAPADFEPWLVGVAMAHES